VESLDAMKEGTLDVCFPSHKAVGHYILRICYPLQTNRLYILIPNIGTRPQGIETHGVLFICLSIFVDVDRLRRSNNALSQSGQGDGQCYTTNIRRPASDYMLTDTIEVLWVPALALALGNPSPANSAPEGLG